MATTTAEYPAAHRRSDWLRLLFAPTGDGIRRRSGSDVARLLLSIVIVVVVGVTIHSRTGIQKAITNALHPPPLGLSWLITLLWIGGTLGVIGVTILVTLLRRRTEVLRDVVVGAGLAMAGCFGIQEVFGVTAGYGGDTSIVGVNFGYPVPILAAAAGAALTIRPYLSRGLQRLLEIFVGLAVFSGIIHGAGMPLSLLASLVIGWGAAAGAHLIFGTPTGVPATVDVEAMLADLGVAAKAVEPAKRQHWGVARFDAVGSDGSQLQISVYGRDAAESQFWAKIGRKVLLRKDTGAFALTRAQQLEHESYLTLLAASMAPGATSSMVASGLVGTARDAVVVTSPPAGRSIKELLGAGESITDQQIESVVSVVATLHAHGVIHHAIDLENVMLSGSSAGLASFDRASSLADADAIAGDTASLLVTLAVATSSDRAIAACIKVMGKDSIAACLPFLQDAALADPLTETLRKDHSRSILKELRSKGAEASGVDTPELAPLHRMSAMTLVLTIGTLIGAWALIEVLLQVAGSVSTLKSASIPWVIVTALVGQLAFFGSAASTLGSITLSVPFIPLVLLELSNTFTGLALGTPGVLAARVRFFQRHGMDTTVAVSSGVLASTASWIVKGGLFLISVPFALGAIHLSGITKSHSDSGGPQSLLIWVLVAVVALGILLAIGLAVPRWRNLAKDKIAPRFQEVVDHFKVLAGRPAKILEIFGGQVVAQMVMALALGAALHAFGESLSLPVLIVVLTLGSVLGGISPVPGGMGVVEAGMILGLKAAGVPDAVAVSAVFVQRLFTAYLPPIAGWFALMWLRRKKYL
jgi:uncharacterized membrane protein YbhN (UPF0104 family)